MEHHPGHYQPSPHEVGQSAPGFPEQSPHGKGSKSAEPHARQGFGERRERKAGPHGLDSLPTPTEEYFREISGVIARRYMRWRNPDIDIDEAEKYFQAVDEDIQNLMKGSHLERREAYYIHKTINALKRFWHGSKIMAAASLIQEEYLEKMRPYDPQFIDEILTALPNHPAARAKAERTIQRINQILNEGQPPTKR